MKLKLILCASLFLASSVFSAQPITDIQVSAVLQQCPQIAQTQVQMCQLASVLHNTFNTTPYQLSFSTETYSIYPSLTTSENAAALTAYQAYKNSLCVQECGALP